jgi:hypothetical protein
VVVVISAGGSEGGGPSGSDPTRAIVATTLATHLTPIPLPAPISGESVVATKDGPLIAGGLDSSSNSVSGAFALDATGGHLRDVGSLTTPLHDAAATMLGNRVLVFGGGAETSTDTVQALAAPGGTVTPGTTAEDIGTLPT